jgi:hypothetical protein
VNEKSWHFWSALVAGASFGLLAGLVLGLSLSPLVAQFLAPLLAIVTAVLGLKEGVEEDAAFSSRKTARAIGFALFCIVGIFSGMWVRINDAIAPDLNSQIQKINALNLDTKTADEIKASMARKVFLGSTVLPEQENEPNKEAESKKNSKSIELKTPDLLGATSKDSVLFAYSSAQLASLDPSRLQDSAAVTDLYTRTGGFWAALAKSVNEAATDEAQRMKLFNSFWNEMKQL